MQTIIILLIKLVKSLSIEQLKKMFQSLEHFKCSFPNQGQTFYHSSIWLKKYFFWRIVECNRKGWFCFAIVCEEVVLSTINTPPKIVTKILCFLDFRIKKENDISIYSIEIHAKGK